MFETLQLNLLNIILTRFHRHHNEILHHNVETFYYYDVIRRDYDVASQLWHTCDLIFFPVENTGSRIIFT